MLFRNTIRFFNDIVLSAQFLTCLYIRFRLFVIITNSRKYHKILKAQFPLFLLITPWLFNHWITLPIENGLNLFTAKGKAAYSKERECAAILTVFSGCRSPLLPLPSLVSRSPRARSNSRFLRVNMMFLRRTKSFCHLFLAIGTWKLLKRPSYPKMSSVLSIKGIFPQCLMEPAGCPLCALIFPTDVTREQVKEE